MRFLVQTLCLFLNLFLISNLAAAETSTPEIGGSFVYQMKSEPTTIHPITSRDADSQHIHKFILDTLLKHDIDTYEWKPALAERYEVTKDNKVFTFYLRKNAVFHDGKPVTAEDVKFSYEAIFEPAYNAVHLQSYFEGISKVEVIDPHTVRFTTKDTYFKNFEVCAGFLQILPKHIYSDVAKSKKMNKTLVGAGPYVLEKHDRGRRIVLKKFDKWYGNELPEYKGMYNFDQVTFRFVKDDNLAVEMIKKGEIDFIFPMTAEVFVKKTQGAPWGTKVIKYKVENASPKPYGYIGWNFRKEMFQDRNVRLALNYLMNRAEMIKKFRYDLSIPATGPLYQQSEYASPNVKPIPYDPKKASELLSKSGWEDKNKNGILEKTMGGKPVEFKFTLIYSNKDTEKYWSMYKEDLKNAGIDLELKFLEWNSFLKLLDEGDFDAAALAWGAGSVDWDPKQIWHSDSATVGGSNFIQYKNPAVDKLIDKARLENNKSRRIKILREVYEKIAYDAPYLFLFNERFDLYAATARMGKPKDTFKYAIGNEYWWMMK